MLLSLGVRQQVDIKTCIFLLQQLGSTSSLYPCTIMPSALSDTKKGGDAPVGLVGYDITVSLFRE